MNKATRILHNLNKYLIVKFIGGDVDFYELEKIEIIDIINAIKKCDKENTNNSLWDNDRQYLINCVNNWCDVYRCHSLVIK